MRNSLSIYVSSRVTYAFIKYLSVFNSYLSKRCRVFILYALEEYTLASVV
jgi:hypothetical protein